MNSGGWVVWNEFLTRLISVHTGCVFQMMLFETDGFSYRCYVNVYVNLIDRSD